jgi:hypothetical protein
MFAVDKNNKHVRAEEAVPFFFLYGLETGFLLKIFGIKRNKANE